MKADLKIIPTETDSKPLHLKSMLEITGKTQDLSRLTPPFFEDATSKEIPLTAFKKRLLQLWKRK